jgi:prepilin-type N-terminal cleavage/methylation domain-containing protein
MHRLSTIGTKTAFSLIEIIIVIVIMGIMAALVGPRMSNTIKQARARDAKNNLAILYSAQQIHQARNSSFFNCTGATNSCAAKPACAMSALNDMNGENSLSIVSSANTKYCCDNNTAGYPACRVWNLTDDFDMIVDLNTSLGAVSANTGVINPCCSGSACISGDPACP